MATHSQELKIFSGNSNPELARDICSNLFMDLGSATVSQFADGECSISLQEAVRGCDVFIIQSTCNHVNDNMMELLIMIDACRRASAGRITAVIPYFGYARQDRKARSRDPISAKLVANLITAAGADRVLTMDLHAAQIQGFFDIPVDNLAGGNIFVKHYRNLIRKSPDDFVVVSPDVGSVARARNFAMKLGLNLAIVDKRREKANQSEVMNIIGSVEGKHCIILDDIVDTAGSLCGAAVALKEYGGAATAGSLCGAAVALKEYGGAAHIYACATHGVLSGPALDRIANSPITELRLLDTIPYPSTAAPLDKISYLTTAQVFAESIRRIHEERSLFTVENNG